MQRKRAPRVVVSSSNHSTSGTGTLPSACSARITATWVSNAVAGNTVCPLGSTRMTNGCTSPSHVASNRRVSFENPDSPGMLTSPTSTDAAPVCAASQAARSARRATGSRSVETAIRPVFPSVRRPGLERVLVHREDARSRLAAQLRGEQHDDEAAEGEGGAEREGPAPARGHLDRDAEDHAEHAAEHQGVEP